MATIGTAGANKNFAPAFTVPATMTLTGYAAGGPGAVRWYRSVDVRCIVPAAKIAAVKAAMIANGCSRHVALRGLAWPWTPSPGSGWKGITFMLNAPTATNVTPWTAAMVTALLAAVDTAITT